MWVTRPTVIVPLDVTTSHTSHNICRCSLVILVRLLPGVLFISQLHNMWPFGWADPIVFKSCQPPISKVHNTKPLNKSYIIFHIFHIEVASISHASRRPKSSNWREHALVAAAQICFSEIHQIYSVTCDFATVLRIFIKCQWLWKMDDSILHSCNLKSSLGLLLFGKQTWLWW